MSKDYQPKFLISTSANTQCRTMFIINQLKTKYKSNKMAKII